ncbi:hypothetical protein ACGFMO_37450 [Streptomyces niveus]|uniref:hypothetical protein n=1 Tax=Streptomyces niveus TaxID=193462 RepID=UPI00372068D3
MWSTAGSGCVLAGQDAPPRFSSPAGPDGDLEGAVPDRDVAAAAWQAWRDGVAFADRFVAAAPGLGVSPARRPRRSAPSGPAPGAPPRAR